MRPVSAAKRSVHDPCRIKMARAPTTVATVARPKVVSLAGWPLLQIADPIPSCNSFAPTLLARTAVAAGITATGHAPLLTLCRRLVEAGHDPSTPLEAYRGTTLCLRARSIGAGARLTVREGPDGKPRFATYRPAPDGRQSCGGQPPTRSNAGEAPAHEAQPHHQPTQKPAAVFGSTPAERFVIRHFINSIGRRPAKKIRAAFGARARQKEISHDGYIENGPRPQ
jgi:hypothetical protein